MTRKPVSGLGRHRTGKTQVGKTDVVLTGFEPMSDGSHVFNSWKLTTEPQLLTDKYSNNV